jgi:cyclase
MRWNRWVIALLFAGLCCAPMLAQSKNLRAVAPGVWFRTGEPLILAHGEDITENTMIVEMKDYLVVIDSGTEKTARATMADCRAISPKPVRYVFLTHHHFDHVSGNAVWTQAGATTMAFAGVKAELVKSKSEYELPKKILEGDSFVLDDGQRRLEFHHYGWAHTEGDGVAWLPKERILFTGDVAIHASCNSFFDAHVREWPGVIRTLEALSPAQVLPGHGAPGSAELLRLQRAYIEALTAQVAQAIAHGEKLDALVEKKEGQSPVVHLKFAPELATWSQGPFLAMQVESVYEKLHQ